LEKKKRIWKKNCKVSMVGYRIDEPCAKHLRTQKPSQILTHCSLILKLKEHFSPCT
jgi:hypothetical protein